MQSDKLMVTVIVVAIIIIAIIACVVYTPVHGVVIGKEIQQGSSVYIGTGKGTGTVNPVGVNYLLIIKTDDGVIISKDVSMKEYYSKKIGDRFDYR